jgi:uncharacterized protein (DUF1800 family)
MSLEGAIAANRFGLGARPGEIARASGNPKTWLMDQMNAPGPRLVPLDGRSFPNAGELVAEEAEFKVEKFMNKGNKQKGIKGVKGLKPQMTEAERTEKKINSGGGNIRREEYVDEIAARFALGITTDRPFAERVVRFWSNHFAISAKKPKILLFAGDFEREAIRPHINANFEDMLFAVVMHPAMQIYLDNWHSFGPNSLVGRNRKKGVNENLGRELMELYTLGVDGGYTQADVIAMAKLLTGWGIYKDRANGFGFYEDRHEPGPITLRGKTYPAGWDGSVAAVRDLADDPSTARNIARKFAAHFISDDPPKESVMRLEKVFKETKGNLHALNEAIVNDPAAWQPEQRKMRTPVEYVTAAMRGTGWAPADDGHGGRGIHGLLAAVRVMGEVPLAPTSPKGWPDNADAWNGSDAMLARIQWARNFSALLSQAPNANAMAEAGLGPQLRPATKIAMAGASTPSEAVALLLASPEFQRR